MFLPLVAFLALLVFTRLYHIHVNSQKNFERLREAGFMHKLDNQLGILQCGRAIASSQSHSYERAFVFIGGFGDPPALWKSAIDSLQKSEKGIICLACRTPGWGRNNFEEARKVGWQEWVLAALETLEIAQQVAPRVTVVAHSTGAIVASVALSRTSKQNVDRAVFTGANFDCAPKDQGIRKIIMHPVLGALLTFLKPVVPKRIRGGRPVDTMNPDAWEGYYLMSFPLHAVREMWKLQLLLQESAATESLPYSEHSLNRVSPVRAPTTTTGSMTRKISRGGGTGKSSTKVVTAGDKLIQSDGIMSPSRALVEGAEVILLMGEHDASVGPLDRQVSICQGLLPSTTKLHAGYIPNTGHNLWCEDQGVINKLCGYVKGSGEALPSYSTVR
mmetsp:Transcript_12458/g.18369  ORF Transcript_12458/g.18369 Transcript_12458/m.18369 type:complete len:388 (-) Transcript_12458:252-1415(-)